MSQKNQNVTSSWDAAMTRQAADARTSYLDVPGGRIAYEVVGQGPLIVLSHGMGDLRQSYRFLAPRLARAGYRVAFADMRGHGDSSTGWKSISRADVGGDLLALIRHLGGPAVIVGQSLSGGAATVAAAQGPDLVSGIVELNPFTRVPKTDFGAVLRVKGYRRDGILLGRVKAFKSLPAWLRYLDLAYPTKPADWADYTAALRAKLSEPDRMAQFVKTMDTNGSDAQAALPNVGCPALIVMGTADPDFPNPRAEGEAIVAALPPGLGTLTMMDGVGHYPHAERPDDTAALITSFIGERVNA